MMTDRQAQWVNVCLVLVASAFAFMIQPSVKLEPVLSFEQRYGGFAVRPVRTIPIVRTATPEYDIAGVLQAAPPAASPPIVPAPVAQVVKPAPVVKSARTDICQKHGMRKVMTGRYSWRCAR